MVATLSFVIRDIICNMNLIVLGNSSLLEFLSPQCFNNNGACSINFVAICQVRTFSEQSSSINSTSNGILHIKETANVSKFETDHGIDHVINLYPTPKNTLHNIFSMVTQQLGNKNLMTLEQKMVKKAKTNYTWSCTYHLKWPEDKSFSQTAGTKQEASRRAALHALLWLKRSKKITVDGKPIIFSRTEVASIKNVPPVYVLKSQVEDKLINIIETYETKLKEHFERITSDLSDDLVSSERGLQQQFDDFKAQTYQKFEGPEFYVQKSPPKLPITKYRYKFPKKVN